MEGDDESSFEVFLHTCIETSCEPQDLLRVVNIFEEVGLWLSRNQSVDIAEGISLITKAIVGWDQHRLCFSWSRKIYLTNLEMHVVIALVELLCEDVNALYPEDLSKSIELTSWTDLIASDVVITDESLAWLIDSEALW